MVRTWFILSLIVIIVGAYSYRPKHLSHSRTLPSSHSFLQHRAAKGGQLRLPIAGERLPEPMAPVPKMAKPIINQTTKTPVAVTTKTPAAVTTKTPAAVATKVIAAIPILTYHVIGTPKSNAPYPQLFVSPENFAAQVKWLATNGFATVDVKCWSQVVICGIV